MWTIRRLRIKRRIKRRLERRLEPLLEARRTRNACASQSPQRGPASRGGAPGLQQFSLSPVAVRWQPLSPQEEQLLQPQPQQRRDAT